MHPDSSCKFRSKPLAVSRTWMLDSENLVLMLLNSISIPRLKAKLPTACTHSNTESIHTWGGTQHNETERKPTESTAPVLCQEDVQTAERMHIPAGCLSPGQNSNRSNKKWKKYCKKDCNTTQFLSQRVCLDHEVFHQAVWQEEWPSTGGRFSVNHHSHSPTQVSRCSPSSSASLCFLFCFSPSNLFSQ